MTDTQQTATACEATLAALEAKRADLVARGAELPELRRGAAYLAHVEQPRQCLLLAQSGHPNTFNQCPLLGVKRTSLQLASMSVIDTAARACRRKRD